MEDILEIVKSGASCKKLFKTKFELTSILSHPCLCNLILKSLLKKTLIRNIIFDRKHGYILYRVSQKTWKFSDELDIVFVMN